jgi:Mn2+/Fe2+ NRAMP family transporter
MLMGLISKASDKFWMIGIEAIATATLTGVIIGRMFDDVHISGEKQLYLLLISVSCLLIIAIDHAYEERTQATKKEKKLLRLILAVLFVVLVILLIQLLK